MTPAKRRYHQKGRPITLTPALIQQAATILEGGNPNTVAIDLTGTTHTTWHRWAREGEAYAQGLRRLDGKHIDHGEIKRDFWQAITRARAKAKERMVQLIRLAAHGVPERDADGKPIPGRFTMEPDWRAAAWWAERLYHEDFGPRVKHEGGGEGSEPIKVTYWRPNVPVPRSKGSVAEANDGQEEGH